MKQAKIYNHNLLAGVLTEDENGYTFQYDAAYLQSDEAEAISLTMPLTEKPYNENILFPFFDGLIPEGWLLDIAELFSKFVKVADKWFEFIDISFLPQGMKEQYKLIIQNKLETLV